MLLSLVTGTFNSTDTQSEFVQKSFLKLGVLSPKKAHVNKIQIRVRFVCSLKVSVSKLMITCLVYSAAD